MLLLRFCLFICFLMFQLESTFQMFVTQSLFLYLFIYIKVIGNNKVDLDDEDDCRHPQSMYYRPTIDVIIFLFLHSISLCVCMCVLVNSIDFFCQISFVSLFFCIHISNKKKHCWWRSIVFSFPFVIILSLMLLFFFTFPFLFIIIIMYTFLRIIEKKTKQTKKNFWFDWGMMIDSNMYSWSS